VLEGSKRKSSFFIQNLVYSKKSFVHLSQQKTKQ
jgi:hypothetical protein